MGKMEFKNKFLKNVFPLPARHNWPSHINPTLFQTVEYRQLRDALLCSLHSVLLHRSLGKFRYTADNNYTLGSVGLEEVNCDNIDLTYVRLAFAITTLYCWDDLLNWLQIRVNSPSMQADVETRVRDIVSAIQGLIAERYLPTGSSPQSSPGQEGRLYGIGWCISKPPHFAIALQLR